MNVTAKALEFDIESSSGLAGDKELRSGTRGTRGRVGVRLNPRTTACREPADRTTYLVDANGNQQIVKNPDGTRVTSTWNFENQPTQYNQPSNLTYPVVTMAYNADNQRVQKRS